MEKKLPIHLQEVLFGSSNKAASKRIKTLEAKGEIHKIAPKIYTSNFNDTPETIIKRNWLQVLSNQYPGAMLSHRSALEYKPTSAGHIFLTYTYTKNITLPGLVIHFFKGKALDNDRNFFGDLLVSQEARAFLENLQETRSSGSEPKTLTRQQIEEKLELILKVKNEKSLNDLRDNAREIATVLDMKMEFDKLDKIIGALLSTRTSSILTSDVARRRAFGLPVDAECLKLFEILYNTLVEQVFPDYPDKNTTETAYRNFAFFESYFSNYIEGTKFEIDEAKQIIATELPLPARDEDSHDVLGTYKIVSNKLEMSLYPKDSNQMIDKLQFRHSIILSSRTSKFPGQFKDRNNFAGDTAFVDYTLVKGTLKKAFDYYIALQHPFAKAVYMMFIISEIHPFLDGNGRIARVMMNAELTSQGLSKIIVPTVYREDYLLSLRKLTRQSDPAPYIRMMQRAWLFSANIYGESQDAVEDYLKQCDAFEEPSEGKLKIIER